MIVVTRSQWSELIITVLVPGAIALLVGSGVEAIARLRSFPEWNVGMPGGNPAVKMGCAVSLLVLVCLAAIQFGYSFRWRWGVAGSLAVSLGLVTPASIDLLILDAPRIYSLSGFVVFFIPLASLSLLLMLCAYFVRSFLQGPVIVWRPGMCRRCGYSLIGNLSGRCPECGEERRSPPTTPTT
jgi:hypothetical protein